MEIQFRNRLHGYLKDNGFNYCFITLDFDLDNNIDFFETRPYYKNYISKTLQSVTGLINSDICYPNSLYDIDLINRITKCLLASGNEEFYYVAWNSFIDCNDEKFILYSEIKKAKDIYDKEREKEIENDLDIYNNTNHTKEIKTKRLIIRPLTPEEYYESFGFDYSLEDYYDDYFSPRAENIVFSSVSKKSKEIVSLTALNFSKNKNERITDIYFYTKKKYRKKGYIKETFTAILDAIKSYEVIAFGQWYKQYVFNERPLNIKFLRFNINVFDSKAAFNTAKSLGFEYMGKNIDDSQETYDWYIKKLVN